jgi:hypothetical protein
MLGLIVWAAFMRRRPHVAPVSPRLNLWMKTLENLHLLMEDLDLPDAMILLNGQLMYNDTKGAIEWTQGCNILSKKLRHLNIHEMAVRDAQNAKMVDISHVLGHSSNISDLMTNEFKSNETFRNSAFQLLSVRDSGGVMWNLESH